MDTPHDTERSETRRMLVQGSALSAGLLLAVALFAIVNYLALRHYKRFDWTSSQLYTLSEKSKAVVEGIDRDLEMVIFLSPASELYGAVDELVSRYAAANPARIKKRVIDPAKNILETQRFVEQHKIDRQNVIVIASQDDRRVLDEFELAEYDYSQAQFGQAPSLKGFKGEQLITSAVLELVEDRKPRILFTTGHGEASIEDGDSRALGQARDLLGKDNFDLEPWGSLGKTEIPTGTDLVVIAGATSRFLEPELELFSRYLDQGGRMLLLLDPVLTEGGQLSDLGLTDWLRAYGVEIHQDIVIDPAQQLPFFGPETLFTDNYGVHPIVESLEQTRTPVLMPLARSVSAADDAAPKLEVTKLIETGAEAWGETGIDRLTESEGIKQDDDDLPGPVSLGVAVSFKVAGDAQEEPNAPVASEDETDELAEDTGSDATSNDDGEEARLVVLGDLDFATDSQIANGANAPLLLNTLNWLVQREQLIAIEARRPEETRLNLSRSELTSIYFLVLGVLPALSIALGVWVFFQRRR